jgi:predicted nucleic acid-binding protein
VKRVFVDTSVLFPFSVMDLMLALTEDGIHDVLWTEALLDEWEEVVTRDHRRTKATARAITSAIREAFADGEVSVADYSPLVPGMPGKDPDDHVHMAAAIAGGAGSIVTWNLQDFPAEALAEHGLEVLDPDIYLCGLAEQFPDEVAATLVRVAAGKRRPPMSPAEILDALHKAGVPRFAASLRSQVAGTSQQRDGYRDG